jgi:integrase
LPRLNAGNDIENWPRLSYEEIERRLENRDYLTWIDYRNAAFIAALALFGRRVSEILDLKVKDVRYDDQYIYASFTTLKQFSPARVICEQCLTPCRASWSFCKKCGASLEGLPVIQKEVKKEPHQLMRTLRTNLAEHLTEWIRVCQKRAPADAYLFPPADLPGIFASQSRPVWSRHITRRMALNVVKTVDQRLWNHLFRHQLASYFAGKGFDEVHLMDWFDWKSYEIAHRYIRLGGGKRIKDMADTR